MEKILFILDRAHGENVEGKCSPDRSHVEWEWSQMFIDLLKEDLIKLNIPFAETVQEKSEPGLTERVRRANKLSENVEIPILLSFHNNAGGGTGNELFTTPGEDKSDEIAKIIALDIILNFPELKWRRDYAYELDKERKFTVIYGNKNIKPKYYGVLIEWLFMDNKVDLKLLKDINYTKRFEESILYSMTRIMDHYGAGNYKKDIIIT